MRLICYATSGTPPKIVPAPVERAWMDQTPNGHAYRCLPLNIANAHGWLILNTVPFEAEWNGGLHVHALTVSAESHNEILLGESHFGSGVLTFHVNGLFRTPPGYDLMVTGPANMQKDAIQPLTGVVETDWAPFTFTMNWRFTRTHTPIRFERDEPFCMIYPVKRGLIDEVEPEIRAIESDPDIHGFYTAWSESRRGFNADLKVPGSEARAQKWQKHYFRGDAGLAEGPPDHRTKLKPKPFEMVRQWARGSLMDQINHDQTDDNRTGRQRLLEGVLIRTPDTLAISPDMDLGADPFDFVYHPGFLTADECALLAGAARTLTGPDAPQATPGDKDSVDEQVALFRDVLTQRPDAAAAMRDIQARIAERLGRFYELTVPVFTDSVHLIRLAEGMSLDSHAIRAHADDSPHMMAHRAFASIVYLNDDYEGGDVYFPRLDLVVKPGAGLLLAFTAGWHHEHGVTDVLTGDQLTMSAFHTFDSRLRDRDLMELDGGPARDLKGAILDG
jgi:hypothetical protein